MCRKTRVWSLHVVTTQGRGAATLQALLPAGPPPAEGKSSVLRRRPLKPPFQKGLSLLLDSSARQGLGPWELAVRRQPAHPAPSGCLQALCVPGSPLGGGSDPMTRHQTSVSCKQSPPPG